MWVKLRLGSLWDLELFNTIMGIIWRESLKMADVRVGGGISRKTGAILREILGITLLMVLESISTFLVTNTKDYGRITWRMVKVRLTMPMEVAIMDNFSTTRGMERVC